MRRAEPPKPEAASQPGPLTETEHLDQLVAIFNTDAWMHMDGRDMRAAIRHKGRHGPRAVPLPVPLPVPVPSLALQGQSSPPLTPPTCNVQPTSGRGEDGAPTPETRGVQVQLFAEEPSEERSEGAGRDTCRAARTRRGAVTRSQARGGTRKPTAGKVAGGTREPQLPNRAVVPEAELRRLVTRAAAKGAAGKGARKGRGASRCEEEAEVEAEASEAREGEGGEGGGGGGDGGEGVQGGKGAQQGAHLVAEAAFEGPADGEASSGVGGAAVRPPARPRRRGRVAPVQPARAGSGSGTSTSESSEASGERLSGSDAEEYAPSSGEDDCWARGGVEEEASEGRVAAPARAAERGGRGRGGQGRGASAGGGRSGGASAGGGRSGGAKRGGHGRGRVEVEAEAEQREEEQGDPNAAVDLPPVPAELVAPPTPLYGAREKRAVVMAALAARRRDGFPGLPSREKTVGVEEGDFRDRAFSMEQFGIKACLVVDPAEDAAACEKVEKLKSLYAAVREVVREQHGVRRSNFA